jgi:hypothetical protein
MLKRTLILCSLGGGTNDKQAAEKFGSLKATLGAIPAVYANDNVRSPLC